MIEKLFKINKPQYKNNFFIIYNLFYFFNIIFYN